MLEAAAAHGVSIQGHRNTTKVPHFLLNKLQNHYAPCHCIKLDKLIVLPYYVFEVGELLSKHGLETHMSMYRVCQNVERV